jgi:translation initiation factor 5B
MKIEVNSELFINNTNLKSTYSIMPVSSKTKEGIPDLLSMIVYISQNWMDKKIKYRDNLNATVMETNLDNKNGWTIDLILKNGTINVGDRIVVSSSNGINISTIRNLLIQPDMEQKKNNNTWNRVNSVRASYGVRVIGSNLDNVLSGTRIYRIDENLGEEEAIEKANNDITNYWNRFDWDNRGVYLLAQTFGELDAGYNILKQENINIVRGDIGNISLRNIENYLILIENETLLENRVFMYFHSNIISDSKLEEINQFCESKNIRFLHNQVIYQLSTTYNHIKEELVNERKNNLTSNGIVSFPCKLKILKQHLYLKGGDDDFLIGIRVLIGKLKSGTILYSDNNRKIGEVVSIEKNNESVLEANERDEVCIRIRNEDGLYYGRHLDYNNKLLSYMDRDMIDILKGDYRADIKKEWWIYIKDELKIFFKIK